MITRRRILGGFAATSFLPAVPSPAPAQASESVSINYGWSATLAAPQTADLHVAPHGDDAATGLEHDPLRTIQRGVDLLAGMRGGSLAIHAGVYREAVSLDALRGTADASYRIHRRGHDRVTITAADPLTGWQACSAADAIALGIPVEGLFVARFPSSQLEHGAPLALNLHEAGIWCATATDRADRTDPEQTGNPATYHRGLFETDGAGRITAVTDRRLVGRPAAALHQTRVLLWCKPNLVKAVEIAGFDPSAGRILLAEAKYEVHHSGGKPAMFYALQNTPTALEKGSWIVRSDPSGDMAVYLRPRTPSALKGGIEISRRPTCIDFGRAQHVELFGLETLRAAGEGLRDGICIRRIGGAEFDPGVGLTIRHCRAGENFSSGGRGYGAIHLRTTSGLTLHNVSIGPARSSFGLFLASCKGADIRFLHAAGVSNSPGRFYDIQNSVLAFSLFEDSAWDAHSNKFNFYEGCDTVLVYGIRTRRTAGYVTYQEASRICFAFCEFDCPPGSQNRTLVSQNRRPGAGQGGPDGSGDPVTGGLFRYWNNSLLVDPRHAEKANSLILGPEDSSQRHAFHNNILHGGGLGPVYLKGMDPDFEERSHNAYTGFSYWQTPRYGWRLGVAEQGIRVNTKPSWNGRDMRPVLAGLAKIFPGFTDWDRDIDGTLVDWSAPPIGARV